LLEQVGLHFSVIDIDVPELRAADEAPRDYVRRVARDKAVAGWRALPAAVGAVALAADTEVVLADRVFGKPADAEDAAAMLRALSGQTHQVLSAVCAFDGERIGEALQCSEVRFAALDEARIAAYVASGEPMGKAGAYAIQGRAAGFIAQLHGSYSGVMGLPLHETLVLLDGFGIRPD